MKGKNCGVQARIINMNEKALYVKCVNHSLDLVMVDSAKSSTTAITFFGIMSRLYTIFSSSPARWNILKSYVDISAKHQSDTRWESRINCVKPLRYYLPDVITAVEPLVVRVREKKMEIPHPKLSLC